ncbi:hypothetical protein [Rhodoferax sp. BLA1]|uniref:hypothetical protein n=1 Tax=Rhodoferax sp. BLA1 TaxID=2576062 RepID=UPI0015D36ACB|nr:hypothetical protein [Rhodoferax sp. BLA1]
MSTSTRTKSAPKTAPAKTAVVSPAWHAPAKDSEPSLRFFHSKALRTQTHKVLTAIETAPDAPGHAEALADVVNDLIDAGMDYYFLRALKQAEVGFVAEQSARLGMSGAVRLLSSVSRKFIVRMGPQQLLVVASHIRTLA